MKENEIKLNLCLPPSINKCYAGYRVRHKSKEYKDWIEKAYIEMLNQKKYSVSWNNWLEATYNFYTTLFFKNWKWGRNYS